MGLLATPFSTRAAAFGFQLNERYLSWDDSAARQLIRMTLSDKLNISMEEVDQRLEELGILVPGMGRVSAHCFMAAHRADITHVLYALMQTWSASWHACAVMCCCLCCKTCQ
jgi:hypothetical protein